MREVVGGALAGDRTVHHFDDGVSCFGSTHAVQGMLVRRFKALVLFGRALEIGVLAQFVRCENSDLIDREKQRGYRQRHSSTLTIESLPADLNLRFKHREHARIRAQCFDKPTPGIA